MYCKDKVSVQESEYCVGCECIGMVFTGRRAVLLRGLQTANCTLSRGKPTASLYGLACYMGGGTIQ
jgi:hypothetical protein